MREQEEATGLNLTGDENTRAQQLLHERSLSSNEPGKRGRGCRGSCSRLLVRARMRVGAFVTSAFVRYGIIALIVLDLVLFLLELNGIVEPVFRMIGTIILWTFVVELGLKLFAFQKEFWSSWWNIFDFLV